MYRSLTELESSLVMRVVHLSDIRWGVWRCVAEPKIDLR